MGKSITALARSIEVLDPHAQAFADALIDRVTVIVGESQVMLLEENDRLQAENKELRHEQERMKEHTGRIVAQVEGLRQDVEALLCAALKEQAVCT